MAVGFFKKIGNFFKKAWDGIKTVFHKVAPVVKTVLPFLAPIIPGGPATTTLIQKGIDIGQKIIPNNSAENPMGSNVDIAPAVATGRKWINDSIVRLRPPIQSTPVLESPRIQLQTSNR